MPLFKGNQTLMEIVVLILSHPSFARLFFFWGLPLFLHINVLLNITNFCYYNNIMHDLIFDWDQWNIQKNEIKHGISSVEAESVFFDYKNKIFEDIKHSDTEKRYIIFGKSAYYNILMIAFTIRKNKIRIISARKASKKEKAIYEKK